jgi:hypothetical protein
LRYLAHLLEYTESSREAPRSLQLPGSVIGQWERALRSSWLAYRSNERDQMRVTLSDYRDGVDRDARAAADVALDLLDQWEHK